MAKHFPEWSQFDEQVPLYDLRGYDPATVNSIGVMFFTRLMPRADVIALRMGEILIVEFDRQMILTNVTRLLRYADAIKNDAVRPDWRDRKIQMVYVTPGLDVRFSAECARIGARYIAEPESG